MATTKALTTMDQVKEMMKQPTVEEQFKLALGDKVGLFTASMVALMSGNDNLQKCPPKEIVACCLQAATLGFTVNPQLGHAYVVPFKGHPTFMIGYKGLIQLALNTGQYKHIHADIVYEGEAVGVDRLRGTVDISGEKSSEKAIGYFAFIELLNGFEAAVYMTVAQVRAHAQKYSAGYRNKAKVWTDNFDEMAMKTVLKKVFKYGYLSVEMQTALSEDDTGDHIGNAERGKEVDENSQTIEGNYTVIEGDTNQKQRPENTELKDDVPF